MLCSVSWNVWLNNAIIKVVLWFLLMLSKCGTGEDSWESLGQQGDKTSQSERKSTLNIHWNDWYWRWSSNTLATWWEEPTHWKRPWCWERLRAGGEGGNRGWDGWMASLTQWIWIWANSGRYWRTGKPGMLQSMGLQRVRHDWVNNKNDFYVLHLIKWLTWLKCIVSTYVWCFVDKITVIQKLLNKKLDRKTEAWFWCVIKHI